MGLQTDRIPSVEHPTGRSNFFIVWTPRANIAYSYNTVIGIYPHIDTDHVAKGRWYIAENEWGPTTGKHLNYLDGGDKQARKLRITHDQLMVRAASIWEDVLDE